MTHPEISGSAVGAFLSAFDQLWVSGTSLEERTRAGLAAAYPHLLADHPCTGGCAIAREVDAAHCDGCLAEAEGEDRLTYKHDRACPRFDAFFDASDDALARHVSDHLDLTLLSVLLIPEAVAALEAAAEVEGLSKTEVTNRALRAYWFLLDELGSGRKLLLRDPDGSLHRVSFRDMPEVKA